MVLSALRLYRYTSSQHLCEQLGHSGLCDAEDFRTDGIRGSSAKRVCCRFWQDSLVYIYIFMCSSTLLYFSIYKVSTYSTSTNLHDSVGSPITDSEWDAWWTQREEDGGGTPGGQWVFFKEDATDTQSRHGGSVMRWILKSRFLMASNWLHQGWVLLKCIGFTWEKRNLL